MTEKYWDVLLEDSNKIIDFERKLELMIAEKEESWVLRRMLGCKLENKIIEHALRNKKI